MKLTKENIYVPLEGYSEEELTELYNFLESINEPCEGFLNLLIKRNKTLEFWDGTWFTDQSAGNKTPVTIEQLKEILQPMENKGEQLREEAKKRGYTHDNFKCLKDYKRSGNPNLNKWYYEGCTDTLFTNSLGNGGQVVYKDGVWAEIIKPIETFTPIAMKCTQEQFEAIRPKLKGLIVRSISSFSASDYLVNNFAEERKIISNVMNHAKTDYNREVYEIWNEEIFLKACGIEVETFQDLNDKNMVDLMGYSVLVDTEEQARKLQEIAFEQGFTWSYSNEKIKHLGEKSFQFGFGGDKIITYYSSNNHYEGNFITKKAHFNDLFKSNFTPIAMRCTQEQFEDIKPKLKGFDFRSISKFNVCNYLINNLNGNINMISNISESHKMKHNRVVHEEWDEEVFLKACGIEAETLQEKEQRLLKELEVVRKEIEDSKIKIGDWVVVKESKTIFKVKEINLKSIDSRYKKITNPQLIELLENEVN